MYAVRYIDSNGRTKVREFPTEGAAQRWVERGLDVGAIDTVLAWSDPR